jgi:hypothetical protein
MTTPDSDRPTADVELLIDHVRTVDEAQATVAVRCMRGPVRLGARFHCIRDTTASIDLQLTRIFWACREVNELDPVHTALVTLRGAGTLLLTPCDRAKGWQIIQGTNPRS